MEGPREQRRAAAERGTRHEANSDLLAQSSTMSNTLSRLRRVVATILQGGEERQSNLELVAFRSDTLVISMFENGTQRKTDQRRVFPKVISWEPWEFDGPLIIIIIVGFIVHYTSSWCRH